MADYTKKNLKQLDDSAEQHGFGETQEARFATDAMEAEATGFSLHLVKPGKRQSFAHKHEKAEEVYVVINGSGRVKLDDEIVELERLDAVRIAPGVTRALEGGDDGLEVLAFGPRHKGDGEIFPGWWSD
jgi:mannose-6-phosphate isomerase-like protein (cupin superfamily)